MPGTIPALSLHAKSGFTVTDATLPLFRRFPTLTGRIPRLPICDLPTPVEPFALPVDGVGSLHIKRDDLTATPYGGNKVRKLEFLLADAKHAGANRLVTFGYAGSNHALATALYAAPRDFTPRPFSSPSRTRSTSAETCSPHTRQARNSSRAAVSRPSA